MLDHHALRHALAAGGEDDVRRVVRPRRHRLAGFPRQAGPLDQQRLAGDGRGGRDQRRRGDHQRRLGLGGHRRQPLRRVRRIEGHVCPARLQHGQDRGHQIDAPVEVQPDPDARAYLPGGEHSGQPAGAVAQLAVGQPGVAAGHRHLVRTPRGLLGEALRKRTLVGAGRQRRTPAEGGQRVELARQQDAVGEDPRVRLGDQPAEQRLEPLHQPGHRAGVEQVGAVLDVPGQARPGLPEVDDQVEAGGNLIGLDLVEHQPGTGVGQLARHVLQGEAHLEQRRVAQVADRGDGVDDHLERHVLVGVRAVGRFPDSLQQLREGRVAGEVDAQCEGVGEEADQVFQLGAGAVGDRGADHDVALTAELCHQHVEAGQQQHEQRDVGAVGEVVDRRGELGRPLHLVPVAPEGLHRRAGPVGRQLHRGQVGELPLPVRQLGVQLVTGQPGPLPVGVVDVAELDLGQRGRRPGRARPVERHQVVEHDRQRPAVRDSVVQRHQQYVPGRSGADQGGAQ